jgi:hypothetical protein
VPIAVRLSTADVVGVHANRQTDAARAGTPIPDALRLSAQDGRLGHARSIAEVMDVGSGAHFVLEAQASPGANVAGTLGGAPPVAGPQRYDLVLGSRGAVQGALLIEFFGRAANARALAKVTLGQRTAAFAAGSGPQRTRFDNVSLAGGIQLGIELHGMARADRSAAGYRAELSVQFVPERSRGPAATCTVTPHARSCSEGGSLAGRPAPGRRGIDLQLALTGALPDALGLTVASPQPNTFPIGGTTCIFFRNAVVVGTFQTDANGNARSMVQLPPVRGSMYLLQAQVALSPRGARVATSNSLEVSCN